jgi:hypothetical protein
LFWEGVRACQALDANNRKVQRRYWEVLRGGDWLAYRLVATFIGNVETFLAVHDPRQ